MLRRILALAALAASFVFLAGVSAPTKVNLDAGAAQTYRAGTIYNGSIAFGAVDSTRIIDARGAKLISVSIYISAHSTTVLAQPYRIGFAAWKFACWDSAGAGEYLHGYAGNDSAQGLVTVTKLPDVIGALTDTLCRANWMPTGIRNVGSSGVSDTATVGTTIAGYNVQNPSDQELECWIRPREAVSFNLVQNGLPFRGRYIQFRFRNLSSPTLKVRCFVELFKD